MDNGRKERLEYAERALEAAINKVGRVRIASFITAMMDSKHLGLTRATALDYWETIKKSGRFEYSSMEVWKKV